jgi:hypothetical protein
MPKFFLFLGYWIGRFSQEEKRPHAHVMKFGSRETMKIWLEPKVEVEHIQGIKATIANKIIEEIRNRKDECLRKWHECERKGC